MTEQNNSFVNTSRRTFLGMIFWVCNGIIGLILGIPLIGYILSPAIRKHTKEWISIAKIDRIPNDKPQGVEYSTVEVDGWMKNRVNKIAWIIKESNDSVTVYSPKCTHLGCSVAWNQDENIFKCPCHGGIYDNKGNVIGGPPPRSLFRLDHKLVNGKLLIRENLT